MSYSVFPPDESDECTTLVTECTDLKQLWCFHKQKEHSGMLKKGEGEVSQVDGQVEAVARFSASRVFVWLQTEDS